MLTELAMSKSGARFRTPRAPKSDAKRIVFNAVEKIRRKLLRRIFGRQRSSNDWTMPPEKGHSLLKMKAAFPSEARSA
jgi:hypothetical protein